MAVWLIIKHMYDKSFSFDLYSLDFAKLIVEQLAIYAPPILQSQFSKECFGDKKKEFLCK